MKEVQRSKEYNSKTGKWEMMSFKENKKGETSVAPAKKSSTAGTKQNKARSAIYKMGEKAKGGEETRKGMHKAFDKHRGTSDGYMAGAK